MRTEVFKMDITTYLISVYCLIDDWLKGQRIRQRGPQPQLSDSEVLTMELVGEFLGIDTDVGLFTYFRWHYGDWFPVLRQVDRTTFTRQAANLWVVKERFWKHLTRLVPHDPLISIVDSLPLPVCRFARAPRCRIFAGLAAYGYDEVARQTYYGLRAHVRLCWPGVMVAATIAPANVHDTEAAEELLHEAQGWALGDRNHWKPDLREALLDQELYLMTPYKSAKRQKFHYPHWLAEKRYRIETVFGQLVERFHAKKIWARDAWHLTARWWRKIISHLIAVLFCQQLGLSPLRFSELITD
jgi:hypothetical protein